VENITRFDPTSPYIHDPNVMNFQVNLMTFDSNGFILDVNYTNPQDVNASLAYISPFYVSPVYNTSGVITGYTNSSSPTNNSWLEYGWMQTTTSMLNVMQVNFYNPYLQMLSCSYQVYYFYNFDISLPSSVTKSQDISEKSSSLKSLNYTILSFAAILMFFSFFDTVQIVMPSGRTLDPDLVAKRQSEKNGTPMPDEIKKFWVFDFYVVIIKVFLPSMSELLNIITFLLLIVSSAYNIQYDALVADTPFDAETYYECKQLINSWGTKKNVDAALVHFLIIALLRYMSEWIPSFYLFSQMIGNFMQSAMSLGLMIIWILMSLTIYGVYTFGPHLNHMSTFTYMYGNLIFITLRDQLYLQTEADYTEYNNMQRIVGNLAIVVFVLFTYVVVTFIMFSIITSIVTKSINETMETSKEDAKSRKSLFSTLGAGKLFSKLGL